MTPDTETEDFPLDTPEPIEVPPSPELPEENGPEEIIREMDSFDGSRKRNPEIQHIQDRINEIPDYCDAENTPGSIKIKIKFINDVVKIIQAKPSDLVSEFKKKCFKSETEHNIKLIYRGHILVDTKSLAESGVFDDAIVHCSISKKNEQEERPSLARRIIRQRVIPEHQILLIYFGMLLVSCTLLFCWFYRVNYSYMFSTYSTIGLGLMTSLFITMLHLMSLIER